MKNKTRKNSGQIPHTATGMADILKRCGIKLPAPQLSLLWAYHELLRRYNPELNLTRIHEFESMVIKLYADSILPGSHFNLPSPLLDLGSGPGMPGIPLGICFPEKNIILSESRKNRVDFLKMAVAELGLKNVSVQGGAVTQKTESRIDNIISRAVEAIPKTLERVDGCLAEQGLAIFMKGPNCDPEINDATVRFKNEYRLMENIAYAIPGTSHRRRLVIFKRLGIPAGQRRKTAMTRHRCREINSDQNPVFKEMKKLFATRGIRKAKQTLVSGRRLVDEILSNFPDRCRAWVSDDAHPLPPENLPAGASWYRFSASLFSELDRFGTGFPLLNVDVPEIASWVPEQGLPPGCSLMIPFQDPENVGAVVRSAVAFGVDKIILLAEAAHPFHPKAVRASAGAVLRAVFFSGPSINDLPEDLPLIVLSSRGKDIGTCRFPETMAILPGIEGPGLPKHLEKNAISIPINDRVESLNAATAAAIALYVRAAAIASGPETKPIGAIKNFMKNYENDEGN